MHQETTATSEELQEELGEISRTIQSFILPQLAGLILQTSATEIKTLFDQGKIVGMTTEAGHCRLDLEAIIGLYEEWFGEPFNNAIYVGLDQAADIMGLAHTTMYHHMVRANIPIRLVRGHRRIDLRVLLEERRKPRPFFDFWHSTNDDRLAERRAAKQQKRLSAGA